MAPRGSALNAVSLAQRANAQMRATDPIAHALDRIAEDPGALFEAGPLRALQEMRANNSAEFARTRARVKESKSISLTEFDRLTAPRGAIGDGDGEMFPEPEPWPEPVDGEALLNDVLGMLSRHVVADKPTLHAATLWVVHTWLIDAFGVSPIANITAPEMRCGKTVLLSAIGRLSYRQLQAANIAPAALFRAIEKWHPTLLIDEVDAWLRENEEARGILNSGFTRDSAFVIRCVGDDHTPTKFSTWGAKALCGIGRIAETLADRSIPLRLRRKTAGESAESLRHSDPKQWDELRSRLARWSADHLDRLAYARPSPVAGLNDRANDCWEPLLAIADEVGAEWPTQARLAAAALHGLEADSPSIGAQLLADIRDTFARHERMSTADLLAGLVADEDSPWPTWNRGRPMTARQLSGRLSEFAIRPNPIRFGSQVARGYVREQFQDAFDRYLPKDGGNSSVTGLQANAGAGSSNFGTVTTAAGVTEGNPLKANAGAGCNVVTDNPAGSVEWEAEE